MASNNDKVPSTKPKRFVKSFRFWFMLLLITFIAGFAYFIKRQNMANESREKEKITYYVSGAVNRALLLKTEDYNNTKTIISKELKLLFSDARVPRHFCRINENGDMYSLMPDNSVSSAELGKCFAVTSIRAYEEGVANNIYRIIKWIPVINWYVGFYLGDVFDSVIYVPEKLLNDKKLERNFYDSIENPCKYLENPESYRHIEEIKERGNSAKFAINAWEGLSCNDEELKTFDINVRTITNNDVYNKLFENIKLIYSIDNENYIEKTIKTSNKRRM
ncbi:MAG: hypothetical protein KKG47_11805 [Proteobacteria bacterium]|nr:hypothetical protein [Pseudomonadota bacterium]MBU1737804.1 hypothetical protein [Pseudomonadota bacterium]